MLFGQDPVFALLYVEEKASLFSFRFLTRGNLHLLHAEIEVDVNHSQITLLLASMLDEIKPSP